MKNASPSGPEPGKERVAFRGAMIKERREARSYGRINAIDLRRLAELGSMRRFASAPTAVSARVASDGLRRRSAPTKSKAAFGLLLFSRHNAKRSSRWRAGPV